MEIRADIKKLSEQAIFILEDVLFGEEDDSGSLTVNMKGKNKANMKITNNSRREIEESIEQW